MLLLSELQPLELPEPSVLLLSEPEPALELPEPSVLLLSEPEPALEQQELLPSACAAGS